MALLAPETRPPIRAGSYLLEEELARGGFGVVWRARHETTGLAAAVKVLAAAAVVDPVAVARFEREARLLRALGHPGVCEVRETGQLADGRPYLAMELLRGETLGERLAARGRMAVGEAIPVLDALASALDAAHAQGIVHRDLKPSNVFLAEGRPAGAVVLLDFGVARLRDAAGATLTGSRETLGTLLYCAPEQLAGSRVDARADVYGLGALAYVMLTGRPPFGERAGQAMRQIRRSARPALPSAVAPLDPAFDAPISGALDREADRRPRSAGAFCDALREAVGRAGGLLPVPEGVMQRAAIAVHAEVRVGAGGEDDEASFADMEAALPLVAAELAGEGLVPVMETSTRLLLVGPAPDGAARRVLDAAARAYRRFLVASAGRVTLAIVVHTGELHVTVEGTLLPGGLADAASWVPAVAPGVVASVAARAAAGATGEAAVAAGGFFWIAR